MIKHTKGIDATRRTAHCNKDQLCVAVQQ